MIIGDTHISSFADLPKEILQNIKESDWVIHVGDFISKDIVIGLKKLKGNYFKGVFGNSDPLVIRNLLPPKLLIEISGVKIGIIHPDFGGSETFLKRRIMKEFKDYLLDIIVYGHTHEAQIEWVDNTLLVNPGRGYIDKYSYNRSATIAIVTLSEEIKAEIIEIN